MMIEPRAIIGGAVSLAFVGLAACLSILLFTPSKSPGSVEVTQITDPAVTAEVKPLDDAVAERTASR